MRSSRRRARTGLLCVLAALAGLAVLAAGCAGAASGAGPGRTGTVTGTPAASGRAAGTQADAFRRFFSTDRDWLAHGLMGPNFGGRPYCAVDVLGLSADARRAYLWVFCQELYLSGGRVQEGTGVAVPVLVTVSGTGGGTMITFWRMPRNGSACAGDVEAMFPAPVAARALAQDVHPSPSLEQLKAVAARELGAAAATSPAR